MTDLTPLQTEVLRIISESAPTHRTTVEWTVIHAINCELPGHEAFAREALRGGLSVNVAAAISDLINLGLIRIQAPDGYVAS